MPNIFGPSPYGQPQQQGGLPQFLKTILMGVGADLAANRPGAGVPAIAAQQRRQQELAQQQVLGSQTAKFLQSQKAPQELVEMANQGYGQQAMEQYKILTAQQRMAQQNQERYYGTPLYGRDPEGNVGVYQLGSQGTVNEAQFPGGITPLGPQERSYEAGFGRTLGQTTAEKAAGFATKTVEGRALLTQIDELRSHPGKSRSLGMIEGNLPNFRLDPNVADFRERVEQIEGGAFLQARQQLKGGGQITDYEGDRAAAALVRAKQAKTEAAFDRAMDDFERHVIDMYDAFATEAKQKPDNIRPERRIEEYSDQELMDIINGQ